jgi:heptose I phosphotransferase
MKVNSSVYSIFKNEDPFKVLPTLEGTSFRNITNRQTKRVEINGQPYFLKYHHGVGWKEILKNLINGQMPVLTAKDEYKALTLLQSHNIAVPKIYGFGQTGLNPAAKKSFILLESIEPSISLEDLVLRWHKNPPSFQEKKYIIEQVALTARSVHEVGVFHRDMYICHFLLPSDKPVLEAKLTLIDFHRAQCFKKIPLKYLKKDLAGLYFSALMADLTKKDLLRFIKLYYNCPLKKIDAKTWRFLDKVKKRAFAVYSKVYGFKPQKNQSAIEELIRPGSIIRLQQHATLRVTEILRVHPQKRMVVKGICNNKSVVAKIYIHNIKRQYHASREEKGVANLVAAKIATPKLLFKTEATEYPFSLLVYEALTPTVNSKEITFEKDKTLVLKLIEIIAQHHTVGIIQNDLHCGNFLITDDVIYTLDGDQIKATTDKNKQIDNLSLFLAQFATLTAENRQELIAHYFKMRAWQHEVKITSEIESKTKEKILARARDYLNKIYRNCTQFAVAHSYRSFRAVPRNFLQAPMVHALGDLDSVISKPDRIIYKNGNTCTVARVVINEKPYAIKRYNIKSGKHFVMRFWRPSRAWRSWYGAHLFQFFGIPTLQPVALIESRWGKIRRKAYFLSELVEGEPLAEYFQNPNYSETQKREIAEKAINLLRQLYQLQIKHGDMKVTNFIVKDNKIFLIDLDSVSWFRWGWRFRKSIRGDWKRFFANWKGNPEVEKLFEGLSIAD